MTPAHRPQPSVRPLMTAEETAALIGVTANTLAKWRVTGAGPAYVKLERMVRYDPRDVEDFIAARRRGNTGQTHAPA